MESSVEELLACLQDSRKVISKQQQIIDNLREQEAELQPIVESNQEVVEAIIKLQQDATRRERWIDIAIGFGGGLLIEIIVAVLIAPWLLPKLRNRRNDGGEKEPRS